MREHRVTSYSRGGRRFARVPGDEKLMVSKMSASSDTSAPAEVEEEIDEPLDEEVEENGDADDDAGDEDLDADNQGILGEND